MKSEKRRNPTNHTAADVAICRWCGNRNAARISGFRIAVHCTCDCTLSHAELLQRGEQERLWERSGDVGDYRKH